MTIQTSSSRSNVKTRSTVERERQYVYAKYVSIGKGPRGVGIQSDPVSKQLNYETRKTPSRAAKAKSRLESIDRACPSLSQTRTQKHESRDEGKSPQPATRLSFSTMTSPAVFSPSLSSVKKVTAKRRYVMSPLAPFSQNLQSPSRSVSMSPPKKRVRLSGRSLTIATPNPPLPETSDDTHAFSFEGAKPGSVYEVDTCDDCPFGHDEPISANDTPVKTYVSFVTGYEDNAFRSASMNKEDAQFAPIIFSPSQDLSEEHPFQSVPWSSFPGWLVSTDSDSENSDGGDSASVENQDEIDIKKLDAELGEFYLFDYW